MNNGEMVESDIFTSRDELVSMLKTEGVRSVFDSPDGVVEATFRLGTHPSKNTPRLEIVGSEENFMGSISIAYNPTYPSEQLSISSWIGKDIRGLGIGKRAIALFFETLIFDGVKRIWGVTKNKAALYARKNAKKIIGSGEWKSELKEDGYLYKDGSKADVLITYLN